MTITVQDIKLLASARMVDAPDGGGPMAGQPLQDGAENNVWPDISSTIDPARGALQLRAVYMAVLTATTDVLRQAHMILQELPQAPGVACLLVPAPENVRSVAALTAMLNAGGDNNAFCGATPTTAAMAIGANVVPVAGVRAPLIPKARTELAVAGSLAALQGGLAATPTRTVLVAADGAGLMLPASMPMRSLRVDAVPGQYVYQIDLPAATVPGSETVDVVRVGVSGYRYLNQGPAGDWYLQLLGPSTTLTVISLDRVTGTLGLAFDEVPAWTIVGYVDGGQTSTLGLAALGNGGVLSALGEVSVAVSPSHQVVAAQLVIEGQTYTAYQGRIYTALSWTADYGGVTVGGYGSVVGQVLDDGTLYMPGLAGKTITAFAAAQANLAYGVDSVSATLPANIDPLTLTVTGETALGVPFSATADALGVYATAPVAGSYVASTGALALTFTSPVKLASLAYEGTQLQPQASYADLWGLAESVFPADGTVRVLRAGQVGVLRHTATVAAATYADGAAVNLGRTDLADVRIVGGDGLGIYTGWTADLAAGTLAISSVVGWAQPVTIQHAIEHVAMITGVPNEATVTLNRPLTRAFPSGSLLSSAVLLGDLQARVSNTFSQLLWDDVWADARSGSAIPAQYQDAAYPIAVSNIGAVTERWALVFKTGTTFDLIGETLGRVASGDTATVFSPINPATAAPYMTIQPAGWGVWASGNVLRINTIGAAARVWAARTVVPGAEVAGRDQAVLGTRGDINV